MMKKLIIVLVFLIPLMIQAQDFSESFDKIQTLAWINKNIKPSGNNCNLRSLKTVATFAENFYDKNAAASSTFDLAKVKFSVVGKKVRISCLSGSCISYSYKSAGNEEIKQLNYMDLEAKNSVSQLLHALNHLQKRVGL